ncbi:hypothetical protein QJS66_12700 [Kocuria rhizophila]|nr:hypothetical protein QJS66_12700 [Kocuria rhizophila]
MTTWASSFQAFNLVPHASPPANIELPLALAGKRWTPSAWTRCAARPADHQAPGPPPRMRCPAASRRTVAIAAPCSPAGRGDRGRAHGRARLGHVPGGAGPAAPLRGRAGPPSSSSPATPPWPRPRTACCACATARSSPTTR